jgi:hypothetical protein
MSLRFCLRLLPAAEIRASGISDTSQIVSVLFVSSAKALDLAKLIPGALKRSFPRINAGAPTTQGLKPDNFGDLFGTTKVVP